MPSHQDRIRQNYCDHVWHYGITVADILIFKCLQCGLKYIPGVSKPLSPIEMDKILRVTPMMKGNWLGLSRENIG